MYKDTTEIVNFNSLPRSSSCPELTMYRNELHKTYRKRALSENNAPLFGSSTLSLSDSDLSRFDKKKTFAGSDNLFQTKDLLSNVLTALGSIQPFNEDIQSCLELNMYDDDEQDDNPKNAFEWTWNGNDSQQSQEFMKKEARKSSIFSLFSSKSESHRSDTLKPTTGALNRSFICNVNPFKANHRNQDGKRYSVTSLSNNPPEFSESTSKRRESKISLSQYAENMELLEKTTIADLIRAIDEVEAQSNDSPKSPLLGDNEKHPRSQTGTLPNRNIIDMPTNSSRRGSLRPVPSYTTVFMSQDMNINQKSPLNVDPRTIPRRSLYPVNAPHTQKPMIQRLRSISESISTVPTPQHNTLTQSSAMLQRTLSLSPAPLSKNMSTRPVTPSIPMITVQPPNVTTRNLLWHPEYEDGIVRDLKNKIERKRSDSK